MRLTDACTDILEQLSSMIRDIREEDFKKEVAILNNSTIGQHVRHTLEFFICLMDNHKSGIINYDHRNHDKVIETKKFVAQEVISRLKDFFLSTIEDEPLKLAANYSFDTDHFDLIDTNYYRELVYNIEHAIHHMAIIKIGLKEAAPYVIVPAHFGVAISTIKFQQSQMPLPGKL